MNKSLSFIAIQFLVLVAFLLPMKGVIAPEALADMTAAEIVDAIAAQKHGRMPGARIVSASCNASISSANDSQPEKNVPEDGFYPQKSCEGQRITRDNFKVKISFAPNLPANGTIDVEDPGPLTIEDLPTYYSENGSLAANMNDILAVTPPSATVGDQVVYNGQAVYKTAPSVLKYVAKDPVVDYSTGNPITYPAACTDSTSHNAGDVLRHTSGTMYDQNCAVMMDCNGPKVVGDNMYDDSGGGCSTTSDHGEPLRYEAGDPVTTQIPGSLFTQRFYNDYSDNVKREILGLDATSGWIGEGDTYKPYPITRVNFNLVYKGAYACVYASMQDPSIEWRVEYVTPETIEDVFDLSIVNTPSGEEHVPVPVANTTRHCVRAPPPAYTQQTLNFGEIISPVCTDFDNSSSKWQGAFTGVVVECIEETMMNIFAPAGTKYQRTNPDGTVSEFEVPAQSTFFGTMQDRLKSAIRALLALYIIFFGYKLMVAKEVPPREEWMWLGIKMALVVYFAMGSGMIDLYPKLVSASKGLSVIVMEAGLGDRDSSLATLENEAGNVADQISRLREQLSAAQANLIALQSVAAQREQELINAQNEKDALIVERSNLQQQLNDYLAMPAFNRPHGVVISLQASILSLDILIVNQDAIIGQALIAFEGANQSVNFAETEITNLQAQIDGLVQEQQAANNAVANYINEGNDGYYNYCDFRSLEYEKNSMKLWDMIDCKISSYLGIGDNADDYAVPQVLWVALTSIVSVEYGIPIFIFTFIFLVFIILIMIKAVHIYIMAFIGLIMLVYISPLIIPSVLFKFTKDIFSYWLQQIMAYLIQPILLFAFLSFMFLVIDSVYYGGNHVFIRSADAGVSQPVPTVIASKTGAAQKATDYTQCADSKAMGCIIQTAKIESHQIGWDVIDLDMRVHTVNFGGEDQDFYLFIALLKMMLICFVIHALMETITHLSSQLADTMNSTTGVAGLSVVPTASPSQILGGMKKGVKGAKDAPIGAYNKAKAGAQKAGMAKRKIGEAGGKVGSAIKSIKEGRKNYQNAITDRKNAEFKAGQTKDDK